MTAPVLFMFFNRPETTLKVFEKIKKYRPEKLYLSCDGPRNKEEEVLIDSLREDVLKKVGWFCEVNIRFNSKNKGLVNVADSIDWFFKNEEEGIILEDDCLADDSFFVFCEQMLDKYRYEDKIMGVSGDNFINKQYTTSNSYFFSKYVHIWGWATWKRAWKNYSLEIKDDYKKIEYDSLKEKIFWTKWFKGMQKNPFSTWDVQLVYHFWKQKGLMIYPNKNLVKNIGFDEKATNTKHLPRFLQEIKLESIAFPLKHPKEIEQDVFADKLSFKTWFDKGLILFLPNNIKQMGRVVRNGIIKHN